MKHLSALLLMAFLLGCGAVTAPPEAAPKEPPRLVLAAEEPTDPDERFLKESGVATDDAGLLAYLRKHCDGDGVDCASSDGPY
ncbi:MAG: hypothetical protein K2R98_29100 [Gemmataceae bacterium]|nr:hypothetical protein [Gemmataceae bacterium]